MLKTSWFSCYNFYKIFGLYPLLGLTILPEPKENALNNIIKEIKSIKDPIISQDMLFSFKVLSALKFNKELLDSLIRREDLMESSIVNEIYQEGIVEGQKKGKIEGKIEGIEEGKKEGIETLQNTIVEILIPRFDLPYSTGKQLEEKIKAINSIPLLQKLVIDAALSKSLDEFLKKI